MSVQVDGSVFGLNGASLYSEVIYTHGPDFSDRYLGGDTGVSGNQGDRRLKPVEVWLSVPLGAGLTAMAGLIDLNSEFDVQEIGGLFLRDSHGMGPEYSQSGLNGPSSYPSTATGFILRSDGNGWTARLGVFDAVAGRLSDPSDPAIRLPGEKGALIAAEGAIAITPDVGLKLGGWTYTSRFDALIETNPDGSPARLRDSRGAYTMIEGKIAGEGASTLNGWLRAGIANDRVNPISTYVGGGLTYGSDGSLFGLAIGHTRLGDPAIAAAIEAGEQPKRTETAFELTYAFNIHERISIQPDVQYILNPGWSADRKDALVLGMRVGISLF